MDKQMNKQQEFEKLVLSMFESIDKVVRAFYPEVNHISMYALDGDVNLMGWHDPEEGEGELILDARHSSDGDYTLDHVYFDKDGNYCSWNSEEAVG